MQRVGAYFTDELKELVKKFDIAIEARGVGMIQALELSIPAKGFVEGAISHGVLLNVTQDTVIRLLPPFLLEEKHVDQGIKVLKKLLKAAQAEAHETWKAETAVAG